MKKQYIQRVILIIAALLIWGNNIIQIFTGILDHEEAGDVSFEIEDTVDTINSDTTAQEITYQYRSKYRDPFRAEFLRKPAPNPKPVSISKTKRTEKEIPKIYYRGLIRSHSGQLAMIEKANGEIVFTCVSENVDGIVIQKITEDSLQYQFQTKKFWLKLNE